MTALATAHVVHALPGRVRVRVPERRGDAAFFEDLASRLATLPAVAAVATNPLTGGVLIHFTGAVEAFALSAAAVLGDIRLDLSPPPVPPMLERLRGELTSIDATIQGLTEGELDARSVLFAGLIAVSAVQLLRGNIVAPAATMLWYAAELARRRTRAQGAGQPVAE